MNRGTLAKGSEHPERLAALGGERFRFPQEVRRRKAHDRGCREPACAQRNVDPRVARRNSRFVPLMLVRHYVRTLRVEYLLGQTYLDPHPKELMLRNRV